MLPTVVVFLLCVLHLICLFMVCLPFGLGVC